MTCILNTENSLLFFCQYLIHSYHSKMIHLPTKSYFKIRLFSVHYRPTQVSKQLTESILNYMHKIIYFYDLKIKILNLLLKFVVKIHENSNKESNLRCINLILRWKLLCNRRLLPILWRQKGKITQIRISSFLVTYYYFRYQLCVTCTIQYFNIISQYNNKVLKP